MPPTPDETERPLYVCTGKGACRSSAGRSSLVSTSPAAGTAVSEAVEPARITLPFHPARVLCDARNSFLGRTPCRPTSDPAVLVDLDEQAHSGLWQYATLSVSVDLCVEADSTVIMNKWDDGTAFRPAPLSSNTHASMNVIKLLRMMRAVETDYVAPAPRTLPTTQSAQFGKQLMPPVTSWLDPLVQRTLVVANAKATAKHKAAAAALPTASTALSGTGVRANPHHCYGS